METPESKKSLGLLFYVVHGGLVAFLAAVLIWSFFHPKARPVEPTCADFRLAVGSELPLPEYRLVRVAGPETVWHALTPYRPGRQCLLKPGSRMRVVSIISGTVMFEHRMRRSWESPIDCPDGIHFSETPAEILKLAERCH